MYPEFLSRIFARFFLSIGASAILTFIYNYYTYGEKYVDWETALKFAILFTLLLTARSVVKNRMNSGK